VASTWNETKPVSASGGLRSAPYLTRTSRPSVRPISGTTRRTRASTPTPPRGACETEREPAEPGPVLARDTARTPLGVSLAVARFRSQGDIARAVTLRLACCSRVTRLAASRAPSSRRAAPRRPAARSISTIAAGLAYASFTPLSGSSATRRSSLTRSSLSAGSSFSADAHRLRAVDALPAVLTGARTRTMLGKRRLARFLGIDGRVTAVAHV
jgi:hypothetical protein